MVQSTSKTGSRAAQPADAETPTAAGGEASANGHRPLGLDSAGRRDGEDGYNPFDTGTSTRMPRRASDTAKGTSALAEVVGGRYAAAMCEPQLTEEAQQNLARCHAMKVSDLAALGLLDPEAELPTDDDVRAWYTAAGRIWNPPLAKYATPLEDLRDIIDGIIAAPGPGTGATELEKKTAERELWHTANRAALHRIAVTEAVQIELPPVTSLRDLLATDDDPVRFRIDRVWPAEGAKVLCAAPAGAGKTTLSGNLVRSLADGDPFLDMFPVNQTARRIVMVDNEMTTGMLKRWLRRQGIRNLDAVADVVNLRGNAGQFDLGNDALRDRWATRLRDLECDFLILDCLKPVLVAMGLDENKEMGKFLYPLTDMLTAAGVEDVLVHHHMGHEAERARGDSTVLGWTDANWKLLREDGSDERHFATDKVRDAEELVGEGLLTYDHGTGRLTYTGGTRSETRHDAGVENVLTRVREVLAEKRAEDGDEMSTRAIRAIVGAKYETVTAALALAARPDRNLVSVRHAGSARFYRIRPEAVDPMVTSVPDAAQPPAAPPSSFEADIPRNTL